MFTLKPFPIPDPKLPCLIVTQATSRYFGRFIGKSYNPRQLVSASPGTPLFEFFVIKENDETYMMHIMIEKMNLGLVLLNNNVLAQALTSSLS
ncbi:hypothetical protein CTI12_AA528750 [Artemisia annua]|uniref:Uncharacterized protein n=1 Tax=Artemisia annua TaxID=35608 RepID=A0A2U1L598_ARTAN|nr:hypothetical protein CTI12_AA528750 [Artemisia annua]